MVAIIYQFYFFYFIKRKNPSVMLCPDFLIHLKYVNTGKKIAEFLSVPYHPKFLSLIKGNNNSTVRYIVVCLCMWKSQNKHLNQFRAAL